MTQAFLDSDTIKRLGQSAKEPAWLTELRTAALKRHAELPWPQPSDEVWRRTSLSPFQPSGPLSLPAPPSLLQSVTLDAQTLARLLQPLGAEWLVVRVDGAFMTRPQLPAGVVVQELAQAAHERAGMLQPLLEADGLTPEEQKPTTLNTALHTEGLFVDIPDGSAIPEPIRLVRLLSVTPGLALFPCTVIRVGRGSSVTLIEEELSAAAPTATASSSHTVNGRIELVVEPEATVHYCRIQQWEAGATEFLLQRATVRQGAQLTMVNINIGGQISKTHVIAELVGAQASSRVFGFVFGHGKQHVDFHSLQHHQAPQTFSDLLYKAALTDESRMIYTGLIRIAKAARQTNAYQANHNLLLSDRAKAETIPMLEILADDVQCKHGATVGPVDEEQLFYLMTRGLPRALAERLLVMGFMEPVLSQVPGELLRQRLRDELEGCLHPAGSPSASAGNSCFGAMSPPGAETDGFARGAP